MAGLFVVAAVAAAVTVVVDAVVADVVVLLNLANSSKLFL